MDANLVKLDVLDVTQARVRLKFCNIMFAVENEEIFVSKKDADWVITAFAPWLKKPPKLPPKKRDPDTYKGGRPTLESQGGHTKEKISITISNEADDHLTNCQRDAENKSQVTNRVILEHKTMINVAEEIE